MVEKPKNQFSIRSMIVLTSAIAVWCWTIREAPAEETILFSTGALIAGFTAHMVHTSLLAWRAAGLVTVLVFYNGMLILFRLIGAGWGGLLESFELIAAIVTEPAERAWRSVGTRDAMFAVVYVLGALLFTPAHVIRPSLPAALTTAIGVGIWYVAGILILSHAG